MSIASLSVCYKNGAMGVGVFFVFFSSIYVVLGCPGCLLIEANKMIKTPPTFTGGWGESKNIFINSKSKSL
jgi:hypothetical protein